jgi:hypothetical protein
MSRHSLLKAGGIPLLLGLLAANPLALKVEQPRVAAHLTGTLLNMVAGDGDSTAGKHMFVKAGGMEIGCKVRGGCTHAVFPSAVGSCWLCLSGAAVLDQHYPGNFPGCHMSDR